MSQRQATRVLSQRALQIVLGFTGMRRPTEANTNVSKDGTESEVRNIRTLPILERNRLGARYLIGNCCGQGHLQDDLLEYDSSEKPMGLLSNVMQILPCMMTEFRNILICKSDVVFTAS